MSESSKKQTFLHGTALLAMATAVVKIIGALYKIPLNAIIGEQGFGYFNTAYEIYNVLLMISTAGLPVAMSRMISQANSLGNYRQVRKIYNVSRTIFLTLGLLSAALMVGFCKQLAAFQEQPDAWAAIGFLGPSAFLICLMSTYRGFFQGQSNMKPTSISQVLEAVVKLVVGIAAALLLLFYTNSIPLAAGGAILGVTVSCLISSFYLNRCFHRAYRDMPMDVGQADSTSSIAKTLLGIAVPITIGSAGLQILTVLETKIYMTRLLDFMPQAAADVQKGVYNMTQTIFNMPCAFITPITISIIPAITAQITTGDHKAARATGNSAARITALIAMPCAVGLAVLAEPITALLGGYRGENLVLATNLMRILGVCILFNATVLLTNAIMQAHGHVYLPVVNMFVGGLMKLGAIAILTGNPNIGILGTPIGSLLCYLSITVLNLISVRLVLKHPPAIVKNMFRGFLAAGTMGVVTFGVWTGLKGIGITSNILLCGAPVAIGALIYLICAIVFRAITREDCLLLPKGEKIANMLHL